MVADRKISKPGKIKKTSSRFFSKTSDIKVGIVGYGGAFNMGRQHLMQIQKVGMTPTAVAELDESRLAVAAADFPEISTHKTLEEMLKKSDVNLVIIITPHNTHAPLAMKCLRAGRHVVCEKPLALKTSEVDKMIAAAKNSGVVLTTYHNRHWDGWIIDAVKRIKKERLIGEIVRIDCRMGYRSQPRDWWRSSRSISGGLLYDWGVHLLEYCLQLIDSEVIEVSGFAHNGYWTPFTRWKSDTVEDEAKAVLRFKSGQWVSLAITHIDSNPKSGFMEITGTQGSYIIDWNNYSVIKRDGANESIQRGLHSESLHEKFYENLRDHLVAAKPLVITPEWSRRPIHFIELACRSARAGRALPTRYG